MLRCFSTSSFYQGINVVLIKINNVRFLQINKETATREKLKDTFLFSILKFFFWICFTFSMTGTQTYRNNQKISELMFLFHMRKFENLNLWNMMFVWIIYCSLGSYVLHFWLNICSFTIVLLKTSLIYTFHTGRHVLCSIKLQELLQDKIIKIWIYLCWLYSW